MVGAMLNQALKLTDTPVKAIAIETGYSSDAFYAAMDDNNKRGIPKGARMKLSDLHLLGGLAVALEATGYHQLFGYENGDRHIQSLIQRSRREDSQVDEALQKITWMLLNKLTAEDLTPEDTVELKAAVHEISDEIRSLFNLLVGIDEHYRLDVVKWLKKEKNGCRREATSRL